MIQGVELQYSADRVLALLASRPLILGVSRTDEGLGSGGGGKSRGIYF
jgi:hypothetical protein